jgi:hypothetical protein
MFLGVYTFFGCSARNISLCSRLAEAASPSEALPRPSGLRGAQYFGNASHITAEYKFFGVQNVRGDFPRTVQDVMHAALCECEIENGPVHGIHVMPIYTPRPDRQEYRAVFN